MRAEIFFFKLYKICHCVFNPEQQILPFVLFNLRLSPQLSDPCRHASKNKSTRRAITFCSSIGRLVVHRLFAQSDPEQRYLVALVLAP